MFRRGRQGLVSACAALALLGSATAHAATITVNETADDFTASGGSCSLREAVQAANTDAAFGGCTRTGSGSKDTILLQPATTYGITLSGIEDANATGDLDLTGKTTIAVDGPGFATLDGGDKDRVIEILAGARLTASKLVITNGRVPGSGQPGTGGGGIRNLGRLTLRKVILHDNEAQAGGTGCGCGGGIENRGRMDLARTRVVHNFALYEGGGVLSDGKADTITDSDISGSTSFRGGGVYTLGGDLTISGSTVFGNDATGSSASLSDGGGIYLAASDADLLLIERSTISGNRAAERGGGIFRFSGALKLNGVTMTSNTADFNADGDGHGGGIDGGVFGPTATNIKFNNSIVAGNFDMNATDTLPDCSSVPAVLGSFNLFSPTGGCPPRPKDIVKPDPKLGPFADNGGPTSTFALLPGSPAIGKASPKSATERDQRGKKRDSRPDIGAYEFKKP